MKIYIPKWPKIHIKTVFTLLKSYLNGYWSWYGRNEIRLIKKFSKLHTAKFALTTVSATSAMETILQALNIGKDCEVIVSAYTWISNITAISKVGATPVIVDINPNTLCISCEKIREAITEKTKAIMPVHLFSAMADMEEIMNIAKEYNLKVIEDCAHAHGALYQNKGAGSLSDAGAFSFQQSKLMSSGEGGMIVTNNPQLAVTCDSIIHIGWSLFNKVPNPPKNIICSKLVFSEFQAAILADSCDYIEKETQKRIENANLLEFLLKDVDAIRFQETSKGTTRRSYYYFVFMLNYDKIKQNVSKYDIINDLRKEGLYAENGWGVPVYKHEFWNLSSDKYKKFNTDIAEKISMNEVICLPHPILLTNKKNIKNTADIIKKVIKKYTKQQYDEI